MVLCAENLYIKSENWISVWCEGNWNIYRGIGSVGVVQKCRWWERPKPLEESYNLQTLSALDAGGGGIPMDSSAFFSAARLLLLASPQSAVIVTWARRKAAIATRIPTAFKQNPSVRSFSMKMVSPEEVVVRFPERCFSNPNLSVIWIVCTSSMSSRGEDVDLSTKRNTLDYVILRCVLK